MEPGNEAFPYSSWQMTYYAGSCLYETPNEGTLYWSITTSGGMYLENATSFLPNVNKFYMNGSYTTVARDQMPSISAPNWGKVTCSILSIWFTISFPSGTILTGMGPEESGIPDNSWLPPDDDPPNVTTPYLPPISGRGKVRSNH